LIIDCVDGFFFNCSRVKVGAVEGVFEDEEIFVVVVMVGSVFVIVGVFGRFGENADDGELAAGAKP
jgi:hypothetical protein